MPADTADPDAALQLGLSHHQAGRLEDAASIYRQILAAQPDHAFANNYLAMIALQEGDPAAAAELLAKAIDALPSEATFHNNLGNALNKLRRLEDAEASYRQSLAIRPGNPETMCNLATTLNDIGRPDAAADAFRHALAADPTNTPARHMLASITGDTTDAAPPEYVQRLFDGYAATFDHHLVGDLGYAVPLRMRQCVDRLTGDGAAFERALDLGCGTGLVGEQFKDIAKVLDGVDLSAKMIAKAAGKGLYDDLQQSDVLTFLKGEPGEYDLIVAAELFIYIGNLAPVFAAIATAMQPGGLFVFSVENLDHGTFKILDSGRYCQSNAYVETLAADNGFSVETHEPVDIRKGRNKVGGEHIAGTVFVLRGQSA